MNPMSLLTLPPSMLRAAMTHEDVATPQGERGERLFAALAVGLTAVVVIVACLLA